EKPPLAWWAQAAAYRLLGVSDTAARVPSAVFAALTLVVTFHLARRLGGSTRAGWLAAGAPGSTIEMSEDMRRAVGGPPPVLAGARTGGGCGRPPGPRRGWWRCSRSGGTGGRGKGSPPAASPPAASRMPSARAPPRSGGSGASGC